MSIRRSGRSNKGTNKYLEALLKEEQEQRQLPVNEQDAEGAPADTKIANDGDYEYSNDDAQGVNDEDFVDDDEEEEDSVKKRRRSVRMKSHTRTKSDDNKSSKRMKNGPADKDLKLRQNAKKMFSALFAKFIIPDTLDANVYKIPPGKSSEQLTEEFSDALERELYKTCVDKDSNQLNKSYPEKVRILYSNLKDPKNLTLKNHIINGNISFTKLVNMNTNELANPDLQHFKEEIDTKSLNQLIIETPSEKPRWIKTHKGEELIESQDEFKPENDVIFERDNIMIREHDDYNEPIKGQDETNSLKVEQKLEQQPATPKSAADPKKIETGFKDDNPSIGVSVSYPEISNEFSGSVRYLGASKDFEKNPFMTALGNGNFTVEGRLSKGRVLSYLGEMKSTRYFLVYSINPTDDDVKSEESFNGLYDFLVTNEKIIGIKCQKSYEKNIYLIPTDYIEQSFIMSSMINKDVSKIILKDSKKLFILVVIKPELLN